MSQAVLRFPVQIFGKGEIPIGKIVHVDWMAKEPDNIQIWVEADPEQAIDGFQGRTREVVVLPTGGSIPAEHVHVGSAIAKAGSPELDTVWHVYLYVPF